MSNRTTTGQAHRLDALLKLILSLMIGLIMTALTPAANAEKLQYFAFEFDFRKDNQHAAVQDYWFGNSKSHAWVRATEELVAKGQEWYFEATTQQGVPGGFLYVKWRDTETQKVYEDTVDLRHRVPKNIEDHTIYLMIKGHQLYVYLVSPDRRTPDMASNGPNMYSYRKVTAIYPDQTK